MNEALDVLHREFVYIWYYFDVQLRQIFGYWVLGVVPASVLGIASPLCMYGTIPLAAAFSRSGMRDEWLATFTMCSILLNPQLILYSTALGPAALAVRIVSCFLCGIAAGLLVWAFRRGKPFFRFDGFAEPVGRDTDPHPLLRLLKNIGRSVKTTGPYFLLGVLMAATVGVPLYACGGGTIPLLQAWLLDGMSLGSAAAFMITGPATKITNLGALKIVLGPKHFLLYLAFVMAFSFLTGLAVNLPI